MHVPFQQPVIPQRTLLCVDFGTSAIKAGCVGYDGTLADFEYERLPPQAKDPQRFTADLWDIHFARLMARIRLRATVTAVIISGHGPTIIAVDEAGRALDPVMLWFDGREQRIDGQPSFFLPRVAWFAAHCPAAFDRTRWFLSLPEYISYRLSGVATTITPSDEFVPYIWSAEGIERYGFDRRAFPWFVHSGEVMGAVSDAASRAFAIPAGVPVIAGGSDFLMSLVGTATVKPGRTCDRAGTSEGINFCSEHPIRDERLRCLPHAVDGRYNVAGILSSTGRIFEWFRDISGQHDVSYAEMLRAITEVPPERHIPWFFPSIREGAAWEFSQGMFIELGAQHGAAEMGRAVVESIGFAVRASVEILEQAGCPIAELRVSGGQAKNGPWNQMKADIIGKPVLVGQVADAEIVGNACAGLVGMGHYESLADAAEALYAVSALYEPDPGRHQRYGHSYARYCAAYDTFRHALRDCFAL
ncbi:MAG: carbohydrate kinase [Spirochaetaceae bacterium]|nr:MAG: carbohydrate kinase [Spirochaetaceae bacterium]